MNKRIMAVLAAGLLSSFPVSAQQENPVPQNDQGMPREHHHGNGHMMGGGWSWTRMPADLTADQRGKITAIRRELRNKQMALMDQMHDQMRSTNYYRGGQFDEQAVRRNYAETEKLRRQMFENSLEAQKRVDAVLTPQQRQQLGQQQQAAQ